MALMWPAESGRQRIASTLPNHMVSNKHASELPSSRRLDRSSLVDGRWLSHVSTRGNLEKPLALGDGSSIRSLDSSRPPAHLGAWALPLSFHCDGGGCRQTRHARADSPDAPQSIAKMPWFNYGNPATPSIMLARLLQRAPRPPARPASGAIRFAAIES